MWTVYSPLDVRLAIRDQLKTGLRHSRQQRVAIGFAVVPGQRHRSHQVRVRALKPRVTLERGAKAENTALAADSGDLDRLRLNGHLSRIYRSLNKVSTYGLEPVATADL
jgi:hypothetical protein